MNKLPVYYVSICFHLIVFAEQRQGTVLPGRVALGYIDGAVGGLGRGLPVTFLWTKTKQKQLDYNLKK